MTQCENGLDQHLPPTGPLQPRVGWLGLSPTGAAVVILGAAAWMLMSAFLVHNGDRFDPAGLRLGRVLGITPIGSPAPPPDRVTARVITGDPALLATASLNLSRPLPHVVGHSTPSPVGVSVNGQSAHPAADIPIPNLVANQTSLAPPVTTTVPPAQPRVQPLVAGHGGTPQPSPAVGTPRGNGPPTAGCAAAQATPGASAAQSRGQSATAPGHSGQASGTDPCSAGTDASASDAPADGSASGGRPGRRLGTLAAG